MNKSAVSAKIHRPSFGPALSAWAPVLFLIFVFLVGGGSRSDVASLPILRGAATLLAFWAATGLQAEDWRRIRTPLLLLVALTLWIAIQLIPLPPATWHALPGREIVVSVDRLLGQPDLWRPISLTPSRTWNSLLAMPVPIAALLLAARIAPADYPRVMFAIVAIACGSALLGLIQILSGVGSAAYLYRITNAESMVGLFANRNHHAMFLACALIVAAMLLRDERMRSRQNKSTQLALAFAALLLTVMTALIGSRAGFVAGVAAFALGYVMVVSTGPAKPGSRRAAPMPTAPASRIWQVLVYSPPILLAMLLGTAIWLSDRTTALSRVADRDVGADMRVQAWPTVQSMIETHWAVGSGFGSFPEVYKIFEPDALLLPFYFNHAHNDWAEVFITGGLPFALIVLAALVWFGRDVAARGIRNLIKGHRGDYRMPVLVVVAIVAATSLVDYPLRVPSLQVMVIILITLLCCPAPNRSLRD